MVSAFSIQINSRSLGRCGNTTTNYPIPPHHLSITFSCFNNLINLLWWPRELSSLELKETRANRQNTLVKALHIQKTTTVFPEDTVAP